MQHWNSREELVKIVKRLVGVPSISGTVRENDMADEIIRIAYEIPYFQKHSENIFSKEIDGDPLNRRAVAALYRGNPDISKTVVLLSHYDVVGIEDYGHLKHLAFSPDEYTEILKKEALPIEVKEDLESGEWLFARGIMDMKAGLALHLGLLSEVCEKNVPVNLLLLSTPDEERNSEGMFAGVQLLVELQKKLGLDYELCICSEPSFGAYPGDRSKYVYLGSVGKLLPLIFCVGKETHVGEPLEGVNASWMAASFTANMELSDAFIEEVGSEKNPPPTCLKLEDLKELYNVQTPTSAYVLYNILTLKQTPKEILKKVKEIAIQSSEGIYQKMHRLYASSNPTKQLEDLKPKVFTYSELYEKGMERYGETFKSEVEEIFNKETSVDFDLRKLTVKLAQGISRYFTDLAPFYFIMLAPPYYPHVALEEISERDQKIRKITEDIISFAEKNFGEKIKIQQYFTGLSDVSYCRLIDGDSIISTLSEEMPLYGRKYDLPLEQIKKLNIPTINLGPYGKDAHKRTERLELSFSLETVPHLLKQLVNTVFEEVK